MYPVVDRLVEGLKPEGDSSAFIDVGGSMGIILQGECHSKSPSNTKMLIRAP